MSLVIVGTMAFDDIESPFGRAENVVGGAALYASWAASFFAQNIRVVSIIGGDFPEHDLQLMRGRGIDMEGVVVLKDKKSFFWSGKYHDDLNTRSTLTTDLNVLAEFDPDIPNNYRDSKYLMLGNLTPQVQKNVIDQMESKPHLIALDTMNFWMDNAWDSLMEVIKMIDILMINDEEARQMSGKHSLVKAAEHIHGLGPKFLVIKKGEHGALLFSEGEIFYAPALPLAEVFDPTGAGDSFAGGFMGYIAKTQDHSFENMKRAVIYGSALASFCVERFSLDRIKELTESQINLRLQRFKNLVHFEI